MKKPYGIQVKKCITKEDGFILFLKSVQLGKKYISD